MKSTRTISRFRLKLSTREEIDGWLYASPWIIGFLIFTLGPMIWAAVMAFTDYDMFNWKFVGLANFRHMFTLDNLVLKSLTVTTKYALMSVPLQLVGGFLLALLLNQKVKGLGVWRTVFYLPSVLSGVAVTIMWILAWHSHY